jgi:hypothetical protein
LRGGRPRRVGAVTEEDRLLLEAGSRVAIELFPDNLHQVSIASMAWLTCRLNKFDAMRLSVSNFKKTSLFEIDVTSVTSP